ncbi:MFS transporter [Methylotenera oryzisoli]|uniref:MFS transporter n=1 Tax=Methylotenera oryzisoli TaxID=2080758 RepID=A0A4Y9VQA1_9PROT|nr:MFS transporter [Methylotenera oryzisoli]TFW71110.1 MFS transporter [Methylotenera oryzisoli]
MTAQRTFWTLVISAAAILAVTMGIRQSLGLFLSPLNTATGLGIVTVSFAMAVAQFTWGLAQPLFGMLADKVGSYKVIVLGTLLLAMGLVLTPFMRSGFGLMFAIGILTAAGAGAGSFSILIGAAAQRLPAEGRSKAAGFINAGGSFGQFIFAPFTQALISSFNWVIAIFVLAATSLTTILLALPLREKKDITDKRVAAQADGMGLKQQLQIAFKDVSYLCLNVGFFTCGFHIAFLVTHLPGEVSLCGLPASVGAVSLAIIGLSNVAGSIAAGLLGQVKRMKMILFWMYASRALAIAIYLIAPKTELTFYIFAAILGFTWLATVPPTAGLIGKLFGPRYLATLFGFALLSHQIGGFFGAWLGGVTFVQSGSYAWMWYADIALAVIAALVNLPIREAHPKLSMTSA